MSECENQEIDLLATVKSGMGRRQTTGNRRWTCSTSEAILCSVSHRAWRCSGWACITPRLLGRLHQAQSLCTLRIGCCWKGAFLDGLSSWKPAVSSTERVWSLQKKLARSTGIFFFRQMQQSILGYAGFSLAPTHSCPLSLTLSPSTGQLGTQKNNQVWIPDFLLLCSFSVPESCHLLKNFPTKKSSWLVSVIKRVLADISPVVP